MVDISYLGFNVKQNLLELPLEEKRGLIEAVEMPFDGMNDQGLVIGMAAVPADGQSMSNDRPDIDSLTVMRDILDHSASITNALSVFEKYDILWGSGPPLHYLIADRSGSSVLVEYYQGEKHVFWNSGPYQAATNFFFTPVNQSPRGNCPRYDRIRNVLSESRGVLYTAEALSLLHNVSQSNTQWSVLYGITSGEIHVTMDGDAPARPYVFRLE
jgi:choloylglycine hydrolase